MSMSVPPYGRSIIILPLGATTKPAVIDSLFPVAPFLSAIIVVGDSETQTFRDRARICQGRHGFKNRSSSDNLLNAPCRNQWQLFGPPQEALNTSRIGIRLRNSDCELQPIVRLLRVLFKPALLISEGGTINSKCKKLSELYNHVVVKDFR